jgi:hypothetical protein
MFGCLSISKYLKTGDFLSLCQITVGSAFLLESSQYLGMQNVMIGLSTDVTSNYKCYNWVSFPSI